MNHYIYSRLACLIFIFSVIKTEQYKGDFENDVKYLASPEETILKSSDENNLLKSEPSYRVTLPLNCGQSVVRNTDEHNIIDPDSNETARIIGGSVAKAFSQPWMCGLFLVFNGRYSFTCGVTIIQSYWVLTAAHCVSNIKKVNLAVICGSQDISRWINNPTDAAGFRTVAKIVINPGYDLGTGNADVALIKLNAGIGFQSYQQPICLSAHPFTGTNIWIVGWGLQTSPGVISPKLKSNYINVVSNDVCAAQLNVFSPPLVNDCKICAGGPGNDTCYADSGGPLIARDPSNTKWVQYGSISKGGCGSGYPGVHIRLSCFLDWIIQILASY